MSARTKRFVVWTWTDPDGTPRFVGWGRVGRNHPAKQLWAKREGCPSDLNQWLCQHDAEPRRIEHAGIVQYYKHEAAAVAAGLRERYTKLAGVELLDPRPWGTKIGGGLARMVMSPEFTIYDSVRQAAVDIGVNACTITRWCQSDDSDWDYLN